MLIGWAQKHGHTAQLLLYYIMRCNANQDLSTNIDNMTGDNETDFNGFRAFCISLNRGRARWRKATRWTAAYRCWIHRVSSGRGLCSSSWRTSSDGWSGASFDLCIRRRADCWANRGPLRFRTDSSTFELDGAPVDLFHSFRWAVDQLAAAAADASSPAPLWTGCGSWIGNSSTWCWTAAPPLPPTTLRDFAPSSTRPFSSPRWYWLYLQVFIKRPVSIQDQPDKVWKHKFLHIRTAINDKEDTLACKSSAAL